MATFGPIVTVRSYTPSYEGPARRSPSSSGRAVLTPADVLVVPGPPPRAALELRRDVFVIEQAVPPDLEEDGRDNDADHAIVVDDAGRALATARLLDPGHGSASPDDRRGADPHLGEGPAEPSGVIGRVAVRAELRGRGLGRAVTVALEHRASERGLPAVELHAQVTAEGFYAAGGYLPIGGRFMEAGIEHVAMRKELLPGLRRVRDADGPALERLVGTRIDFVIGLGFDHAIALDVSAFVALHDHKDADVMELMSLYVAAVARRRGWGTRLVWRAEREARSRSVWRKSAGRAGL